MFLYTKTRTYGSNKWKSLSNQVYSQDLIQKKKSTSVAPKGPKLYELLSGGTVRRPPPPQVHGRALVEAQGANPQKFLAFWRPKDMKTANNNIQKIL